MIRYIYVRPNADETASLV